jgi:hypothetical protein
LKEQTSKYSGGVLLLFFVVVLLVRVSCVKAIEKQQQNKQERQ